MIPANSMYLAQLKASWSRTVGVTTGVALISAILVRPLWVGEVPPVGCLRVPRVRLHRIVVLDRRAFHTFLSDRLSPTPRWCFRILCWAILLNFGALVGFSLLCAIGVMPWSFYGQIFWMGFIPSTVIGVIGSVGFTMYETLKFDRGMKRCRRDCRHSNRGFDRTSYSTR